jgi:phosphoribosylformimino-5-aminoimidazole carboxamide ribotide isomerase
MGSKRFSRFRPCIDLHAGKVKQIVGSTLSDDPDRPPVENFVASRSSAEFGALYRDSQLEGGHIIMLGPGNEEAALAALAAYPSGLQVGGGINPQNARRYLDAGASHIIVTSYVFRDGRLDRDRLAEMVRTVGPKRLVLDLSCRRKEPNGPFYVVTDRWQKFTDLEVNSDTLRELSAHCDEFLVHAVDVEGMQSGVESELVVALGRWSPIRVTYAGGCPSTWSSSGAHLIVSTEPGGGGGRAVPRSTRAHQQEPHTCKCVSRSADPDFPTDSVSLFLPLPSLCMSGALAPASPRFLFNFFKGSRARGARGLRESLGTCAERGARRRLSQRGACGLVSFPLREENSHAPPVLNTHVRMRHFFFSAV